MFWRWISLTPCMLLMGIMLTAPACGASHKTQEDTNKCLKHCELDLMTCLESSACINEEGQRVPCQDECETQKTTCDEACGG